MKYLIDTHILLWALGDFDNLSTKVSEILKSKNEIYVSIASIWEIAIKKSIGKLDFNFKPTEIESLCESIKIKILPIATKHIDKILELPQIHNDPFDRIIISQSLIEDLPLITKDTIIPKYPNVQIIW